MADKSKSPRRWPAADILRRAEFVKEAGPIRFVGTECAARRLAWRRTRWSATAPLARGLPTTSSANTSAMQSKTSTPGRQSAGG